MDTCRHREVPVFAAAGVNVHLVLIGAGALGPPAVDVAVTGLMGWWWLSGGPGREAPRLDRAHQRPLAAADRQAQSVAADEPPDQLGTSLLCRLWGDLADRSDSQPPSRVAAGRSHSPEEPARPGARRARAPRPPRVCAMDAARSAGQPAEERRAGRPGPIHQS